MSIQSKVGGKHVGGFDVCTHVFNGTTAVPLPTEMPLPARTDTGMFVIPPSDNVILAANPFCANPSCGHIFGIYHSQFLQLAREHRPLEWFLRSRLAIIAGCDHCRTSKVIDEETYASLYKV